MLPEVDPQEQLAEIRGHIAEARSVWEGGGPIAIVGACITAVAVLVHSITRLSPGVVWALHNATLWTFVLVWNRREERREGRISLRGRYVLRLWAMVTLCVWLCVGTLSRFSASPKMYAAFIPMFLSVGIFATGLLSESAFSQIVGVALAATSVGIAVMVPHPVGSLLALVSIVVAGIVWGLGSFVIRRQE